MKDINPHLIFARCFDEKTTRIAELLSEKLSEGNICLDIDEYNKTNKEDSDKIIIDLVKQSNLLSDYTQGINGDVQPFVLMNNNIYLRRYFKYETTILNKIISLLEKGKKEEKIREKELLANKDLIVNLFAKPSNDKNNDNWQLLGAVSCFLNGFSIITGGPGTGKTTTIAKLLTILYTINPDIKVALAAPTGKAAARMNETLKQFENAFAKKGIIEKIQTVKASSIHRLLGGFQNFYYNEENELPFDVIIVDESSMIDAALLAKLISAVNDNSRLIMLGDSNQLCSIEAGSVFGDLCKTREERKNKFSKDFVNYSNKFIKENLLGEDQLIDANENVLTDCTIELEYSHRFDNTKGIGKFSKEVINGNNKNLNDYLHTDISSEFVKILPLSALNISDDLNDFTKLIDGYKEYISKENISEALKSLNKVKVLCATREGSYGVYNLNKMIEKYLDVKKENEVFYHNQPVLININNNELGIFNGDIGIVRENAEGIKMAYFEIDGEVKPISLIYITDYETAFAMTIHKSQGSEYLNVGVVLPPNEQNKLLSRELLYTAVTRAKEKAFIFSSKEILEKTIATRVKRSSGITMRIQKLK